MIMIMIMIVYNDLLLLTLEYICSIELKSNILYKLYVQLLDSKVQQMQQMRILKERLCISKCGIISITELIPHSVRPSKLLNSNHLL